MPYVFLSIEKLIRFVQVILTTHIFDKVIQVLDTRLYFVFVFRTQKQSQKENAYFRRMTPYVTTGSFAYTNTKF